MVLHKNMTERMTKHCGLVFRQFRKSLLALLCFDIFLISCQTRREIHKNAPNEFHLHFQSNLLDVCVNHCAIYNAVAGMFYPSDSCCVHNLYVMKW